MVVVVLVEVVSGTAVEVYSFCWKASIVNVSSHLQSKNLRQYVILTEVVVEVVELEVVSGTVVEPCPIRKMAL